MPAHATCEQVDARFEADGARASVLVSTPDGGCVLVNRAAFYQAMTGRLGFGRTMHYRRSIHRVVTAHAVCLRASTSLEDASLEVLAAQLGAGDDVLVDFRDGWGTVPVRMLFDHAGRMYRERTAEVASREARLQALVQHAVDVILLLDTNGHITYCSRDVDGMAPFRVGESMLARVAVDDAAELATAFRRARIDPSAELRGEFRASDLADTMRLFEYNGRNLTSDPAVGGLVINFRDITERRAMEEQLRHHASHDPLTGLPNRELLLRRARYALARLDRVPGTVALLYVDLDGFKTINDSFGHAVGDQVLVEIAHRMDAIVRRGDTVARFGGDEFVILTEDREHCGAGALAARILAELGHPLRVDGRGFHLRASIGFTETTGAVPISILLNQADAAMYAAKSAGGNGLVRFDPASHDQAVRVRLLSGDLRLAIARDELLLVYQPIFRARTLELVGVEALLRWSHSSLGPISPVEFIPIAEAQGVIGTLGRWVIDAACRDLAAWDAQERPSWVAVNLSAHQLDEPDLVPFVRACLERHGLRAAQLHLELTETAIATGNDERMTTLRALREVGVSLSLDDFGTGYSSLSALNHVPLDTLKIDRSFVTGLGTTPESTLMLRSIVELAHALGYSVVAEGVEQLDELHIVQNIGCDQLQGYLLGRPAPAPLGELEHGCLVEEAHS
jgi:diguanylate cyclase (GGDEF)-like protein/PAS domain S-box-containing protein